MISGLRFGSGVPAARWSTRRDAEPGKITEIIPHWLYAGAFTIAARTALIRPAASPPSGKLRISPPLAQMGTVNDVQKRRFSGAGATDHANHPSAQIETDAIQYGLLRAPGFAQVAYAQDLYAAGR